MTDNVLIRWIDGQAPTEISGGTTWGMPFPRGSVQGTEALAVTDAAGTPVPSQAWPLATWPDGSLKWAGVALPATGSPSDTYDVTADASTASAAGQPPSDGSSVSVSESADAVDHPLQCTRVYGDRPRRPVPVPQAHPQS